MPQPSGPCHEIAAQQPRAAAGAWLRARALACPRRADASPSARWQALASLRSLQGFPDEALALLRQSIAIWLPLAPPAAAVNGEQEEAPPLMGADLPSFEFRFEAAKLLLDLDETTEVVVSILEARATARMSPCPA